MMRYIFSLILFFILCMSQCVAQYSFGPLIMDYTLRSGSETVLEFKLDSLAQADVTCKSNVSDMKITLQGKPEPVTEQLPRGCSKWMTLVTPSVLLEAGASKKLECKVKVPRDANGSYSALLTVDIVTKSETPGGELGGVIRFTQRKAAVVLLNVQGSGKAGANVSIASLGFQIATDASNNESPDKPTWAWSVLSKVTNSGNVHAKVNGDVTIRDAGSSRIIRHTFDTGKGYVLAGTDRAFEANGNDQLSDGIYLVTISFRPRGTRVSPISASQTFVVSAGKVTTGEPSEAMLREIEAARPAFFAAPESMYYEVPPRGRRSQQVMVYNMTNQPLNLVPYIVPWEQNETGGVTFPETPKNQRFISGAVTVSPAKVTIPARGQKSVNLTFAMPTGAEGEYYSALIFAPEGQQLSTDPDVLAQRAILITAAVPETLKLNATVSQLDMKMLESGAFQFNCSVINDGNARCGLQGKINVSKDGKAIDELEFGSEEIILLPGESRDFTIDWPRVLEPGQYQASVLVEYTDSKYANKVMRFEIK